MDPRYETYFWLRGRSPDGPPVLFCRNWHTDRDPKQVCGTELQFVVCWSGGQSATQLNDLQARISARFPRWDVWVMVASRRLAQQCRNKKIFWCSDAITTNESWWKPQELGRYYTGVTVATLEQYNRHELLEKVDRALLVTYSTSKMIEREQKLRRSLKRCYFIATRGAGWNNPTRVLSYYNQSSVGLALSDLDCGTRMVAELQLCGLPIVATHSRSGATELVDHDFLRLVPPSAPIVSAAVDDLLRFEYSPQIIRDAFLMRLQEHREIFKQRFGPINWGALPPILWQSPVEDWNIPC